MTEREKFNDWAEANGFGQRMGGVLAVSEPDVFKAGDQAFEIWQASRKQALEDAAVKIETTWKGTSHEFVCKVFSGIVRSVANPEGEQG